MVYQNIFKSEYYFEFKGYKLYFSSLFNKKRFADKIDGFIIEENIKNTNKYGLKIDLTNYLIIVLYKKIEKRGFRVYNKNGLMNDYKFII